MNAQLSTFRFESYPIQVLNRNNEAWFIASEIACVFGYRDTNKLSRILDDDEKDTHNVGTLGGVQIKTIINESGLYHAALKSRKPEAQKFRKWVTSEVLPAIRKTGTYLHPSQQSITYEPTTHEVEDDVLQTLFNFLFLAHSQAVLLKNLYPALTQLMSRLHPEVYSLYSETGFTFNLKRKTLETLLTQLAQTDRQWKQTLKQFNELQPLSHSKPQTVALIGAKG